MVAKIQSIVGIRFKERVEETANTIYAYFVFVA